MQSIKLLLGASALALLAACSGGGDGGGATVTGGVVKGPVLGSTVCAYALTGGAKGAAVPLALGAGAAGSISGGCYVTPADGTYNFALPAGTSGDLLIEATGGTFCSNESQVAAGACTGGGTVINLGSAVMSSIVAVPAAGSSATVFTTPLTTAAVTGGGAGMTSARFNERFNTLAGQVIGAGTPVTPATPPTAGNQPYLATAATALQNGGTLSTIVTALNNGTTTFAGGGSNTPATVDAALVGTYNLKFYAGGGDGCGTVCSYTDGQDVPVIVYADGRLSIPGKTLTNPFNRDLGAGPHTPEIIWLDSETGVEYALSDNSTGAFNEINVGDASDPQGPFGLPRFLGQIRMPAPDGAAALTALQGSYPVAYQYNGNPVSWTGVTIGSDGGIAFTGGAGPDMPAANRTAIDAFLNVVRVTGTVGTGTLSISFYKASGGALRSVMYDLAKDTDGYNDTGVRLGTVTALATHDGTPLPSNNAIHGTLGSTTMNFTVTFSNGSANSLGVEAANGSGAAPVWLINMAPGAAIVPGTYNCMRTPAATTFINVRTVQNGTLYTTMDGGRCEITITAYTHSGGSVTSFQGKFVAEIYDNSQQNAPLTVVNGVFNIAP